MCNFEVGSSEHQMIVLHVYVRIKNFFFFFAHMLFSTFTLLHRTSFTRKVQISNLTLRKFKPFFQLLTFFSNRIFGWCFVFLVSHDRPIDLIRWLVVFICQVCNNEVSDVWTFCKFLSEGWENFRHILLMFSMFDNSKNVSTLTNENYLSVTPTFREDIWIFEVLNFVEAFALIMLLL